MFTINGIDWEIIYVNPFSDDLRRSDGSLTVGVTDMPKRSVFLSNRLRGAFLRKVLAHELVHCFMFSYSIHIPIEEEEYIADWVATYGTDLIYLLDDLMRGIISRVA
jgi:hypothetical protein